MNNSQLKRTLKTLVTLQRLNDGITTQLVALQSSVDDAMAASQAIGNATSKSPPSKKAALPAAKVKASDTNGSHGSMTAAGKKNSTGKKSEAGKKNGFSKKATLSSTAGKDSKKAKAPSLKIKASKQRP